MNETFLAHFRCPDSMASFELAGTPRKESGYFRFGEDVDCYGRSSAGTPSYNYRIHLDDVSSAASLDGAHITLPFDPDEIANNLRCESYTGQMRADQTRFGGNAVIRAIYYLGRPAFPVHFRRILQRIRLQGGTHTPFPHWPVDRSVDRLFEELMKLVLKSRANAPVPFIWFWPEGAPAAAIVTHDVETELGRDFCSQLMDMDDEFGIKSSFQIVPEKRYEVTQAFLEEIWQRGFEVNVHDLYHDGNLFRNREEFLHQAEKINSYIKKFNADGFRSGALYRNLRWYDAFKFSYDMSVPNVGHLDAQTGGCCTIMPYFVGKILEIPVTATQDYSLFHILGSFSTTLWEEQCRMILAGFGLINVIVHPDYIINKKSNNAYRRLLGHLAYLREKLFVWTTLPGEINKWWRIRSQLSLVQDGQGWRIEGKGNERARIAYAHLVDGRLKYSFDPAAHPRATAGDPESIARTGPDQKDHGLQRSPYTLTRNSIKSSLLSLKPDPTPCQ
jgi:hypothetical protein